MSTSDPNELLLNITSTIAISNIGPYTQYNSTITPDSTGGNVIFNPNLIFGDNVMLSNITGLMNFQQTKSSSCTAETDENGNIIVTFLNYSLISQEIPTCSQPTKPTPTFIEINSYYEATLAQGTDFAKFTFGETILNGTFNLLVTSTPNVYTINVSDLGIINSDIADNIYIYSTRNNIKCVSSVIADTNEYTTVSNEVFPMYQAAINVAEIQFTYSPSG